MARFGGCQPLNLSRDSAGVVSGVEQESTHPLRLVQIKWDVQVQPTKTPTAQLAQAERLPALRGHIGAEPDGIRSRTIRMSMPSTWSPSSLRQQRKPRSSNWSARWASRPKLG